MCRVYEMTWNSQIYSLPQEMRRDDPCNTFLNFTTTL